MDYLKYIFERGGMVGLPASPEEGGGSLLGFSLEGNPLLYLVILAVLGITCIVAYRYFKV